MRFVSVVEIPQILKPHLHLKLCCSKNMCVFDTGDS